MRFLSMILGLIIICDIRAQNSFTLETAVKYALENNGRLAIQKTDIQDVEGQIKEYYAIGMPKLTAKASYNHFIEIPTSILPNFISPAVYNVLFDENLLPRRDIDYGGGIPVQFGTKNNLTGSLEFSTLLFDGSFLVGLKAQSMYKDLIKKQITQSETEVKYNVTKAYLSALAIKENTAIVNKNIANLNTVLKELKEIYKTGFAEKLDVDRLDLSLQNLNIEAEKLQRLQLVLENVLKFQMGYPIQNQIILSQKLDDIMTLSYMEVMDPSIKLNIENRPEYTTIQQGIKLAEINIKRYKYAYYPSLFGFASFQESLQRTKLFDKNDNKWFPTSLVGVNLNAPIFDGFDKKSKISRAKTLLNKSVLQYNEFERAVNLEFENAKIQYINALATLEARKKSLALAQKIYDTTKIKYKEGVGSSLEITSSERDLYQAQANVLEAQINVINAKVDLDKSMGKI